MVKQTTTSKINQRQRPARSYPDYFVIGGILLFTFLLYLHSLKNGFVDWDDTDYLRDNLVIHQIGWEQLKTIFSSFYSGNYHPLTTLSFALEYAVAGYRSAFLYHFNNLWLHLVNVLLIYCFIRMINSKWQVAAITAFWFGIHPMHVESVAWISERKDLLYAGFFLTSLISYCYYQRLEGQGRADDGRTTRRKGKFYMLALFFFILSLLSKSAAVVLPIILLLVDYQQGRKFSKTLVAEKIPFFLLAVLFGVLAILSQSSAIQRGMEFELSASDRFFTVSYAVARYLQMLVFPVGLSAYHPYPLMTPGFRQVIMYLSVVFDLFIIFMAFYLRKNSRNWLFGLFFFITSMLLVLQIVPVGGAYMAERYTYLAYTGVFYILACLFAAATERIRYIPVVRLFVTILFFFFSILFTATSFQRIGVWNSSFTLFDDIVNKYPENYLAYNLRASAVRERDVEQAIVDYTTSIRLNPKNPRAYNNRGNIYSAGRKFKEALADYNAALQEDPTLTEALNNRGAIKAIFGDMAGALADINRSLLLKPASKDAYRNRGLVKMQLKDLKSAREDWQIAAGLGDEISRTLLTKYPD